MDSPRFSPLPNGLPCSPSSMPRKNKKPTCDLAVGCATGYTLYGAQSLVRGVIASTNIDNNKSLTMQSNFVNT